MKNFFKILCTLLCVSFSTVNAQEIIIPNTDLSYEKVIKKPNAKVLLVEETGNGQLIRIGRYNSLPSAGQVSQVAEDFIVPTGERWDIDSFTVRMAVRFLSGVEADRYTILFYEDNNGVPGSVKFTLATQGNFGIPGNLVFFNLRIDVDETVLQFTEGKYWVSIVPIYETASPSSNGMALDGGETITSGGPALFRDSIPANLSSVSDWTTFSPNGNPLAFAFSFRGDVVNLTGVSELVYENGSIEAYPNPAENQITFSTQKPNGKVSIYDATGKIIDIVSISSNKTIHNIDEYENGIYFYQLVSVKQELVGSGKFIVR